MAPLEMKVVNTSFENNQHCQSKTESNLSAAPSLSSCSNSVEVHPSKELETTTPVKANVTSPVSLPDS